MSLDAILTQSAALEQAARATLGIAHAYDESPEATRYWPFTVRYPRTGDWHASRGLGKHNIHHFIIEVHLQRSRPGGLLECEKLARPMFERFQTLYATNLSINGTCDVSGWDLPSWEYGRLEWAGEVTIGIRMYGWAKEMLEDIPVNL